MSALTHLAGTRWKTRPFDLCFAILRVRAKTVLVYDEQEERVRTLPRAIIVQALREKHLVYLGRAERRRSA